VNFSTIKRSPHAIDRHVGNRVRMRRKMQGMTQEKLGEALGVTFQQVQKYEKGTNRIGGASGRVACNILLQFSKSQSLSSSKMYPDNRPSWTSLATMSPASSRHRMGLRSRKPLCTSKTRS
jgi:DNA-binding XRE family transcriptional regulator